MVAAGRSGLCAPFSALPAPKNKLEQVQTPCGKSILQKIDCSTMSSGCSSVRPEGHRPAIIVLFYCSVMHCITRHYVTRM
jgi:hypothetical protein